MRNFGQQKLVERKPYLQCLLSWDALLSRGLTEMVSQAPSAYFRCLLRAERPGEVLVGLPARAYETASGDRAAPLSLTFVAEDAPASSDEDVVVAPICNDAWTAVGGGTDNGDSSGSVLGSKAMLHSMAELTDAAKVAAGAALKGKGIRPAPVASAADTDTEDDVAVGPADGGE